jgi:hypothetical protein
VVSVGIDFSWQEDPIDEPRKMGLDEFEFTGNQRILGQRHKELNRARHILLAR